MGESLKDNLKAQINMEPDEIMDVHNRVSKLMKYAHKKTFLCQPSYSISVCRLMRLREAVWNARDKQISKMVLQMIDVLAKTKGHKESLALGCLGVKRANLKTALTAALKESNLNKANALRDELLAKQNSENFLDVQDTERTEKQIEATKNFEIVEVKEAPETIDLDTLDPVTLREIEALKAIAQ